MTKKTSFIQKILNFVEKAGNALPHPATLFLLFAVSTLIVSAVGNFLDWSVIHPGTKKVIAVESLLSVEGLHFILEKTVKNFTNFAPLGIVLVAMLGIGIAESSGLIAVAIRLLVLKTPKNLLTFVLVFAGVVSNFASDVGYVLLIPLGGIIFHAVGRNPIAGLAATFSGVSGGFSANLMLGSIDPLLAGLSQEAAQILDPNYLVNPTANYYFMIVSTFVIAFAGTFVTEKIVIPRLGKFEADHIEEEPDALAHLSPQEKKGLLYSSLSILAFIVIIIWGLYPENGFLRAEDGSILRSPLLHGIVTVLFLTTAVAGIIYGLVIGKFKNDTDIMVGMAENMKTLATYIVLVFFAAQFVAYFKESQLGIFIAVKGAEILKTADLHVFVLMTLFIIFASSINMLMGSASAKWAIMAPVFIPIFMLMGFSPELSQVVFRIGDSITNIISPMMSFFALIIAYFQKYNKDTGIGTIISTMIPYTIVFFIAWAILLFVWIYFDIPLGPGAGLYYNN